MADKLMHICICKFTPSVNYNWWLKCLDTQLNEQTKSKLIKIPESCKANELDSVILKLLGSV